MLLVLIVLVRVLVQLIQQIQELSASVEIPLHLLVIPVSVRVLVWSALTAQAASLHALLALRLRVDFAIVIQHLQ